MAHRPLRADRPVLPGTLLIDSASTSVQNTIPFRKRRPSRHQLRTAINSCTGQHERRSTANVRGGESGRRSLLLLSSNVGILAGLLSGTDDPTTVLNSVLGAYGLPKLPGGSSFRLYDDFDEEYVFEYPRSWVGRSNSQRAGVYVSDFNTADKAVVEIFPAPGTSTEAVQEVVRRAVSPGSEIGGDARLIMPDDRRIRAEEASIGGTTYTYVRFPSETVTRSGYQIRRKNFAVAAARNGLMYSLVASSRSDQFNPEKEKVLQHIVQSFRVRSSG